MQTLVGDEKKEERGKAKGGVRKADAGDGDYDRDAAGRRVCAEAAEVFEGGR